MVALAELSQGAALGREKNRINLALRNLAGGGRITDMTISPPAGEVLGAAATIETVDVESPPAMIAAITQLLEGRLTRIEERLTEMGVTELR